MTISNILNARSLSELLNASEEFCKNAILRDNDADYIKHEINRYIPTSRIVERSAKEMFVDYFYDVLKYKDRKPGIYTHFDKHMERVLILEFYRRIIKEYFKTQ